MDNNVAKSFDILAVVLNVILCVIILMA